MTTTTLSFIDELQGATYSSLSSTSFQVGIVDPDSSGLTTSELSTLEASGKTVLGYLSIGEAENFRSYWQASWNTSPPSWILGQDPNWAGDYYVNYSNTAWQAIVINEAVTMAKEGYNGTMLDVTDAYSVAKVASAMGGTAAAITSMENFIIAISEAAKAINPNFKIILNNPEEMLVTTPSNAASATNTAFLSHIDGVVAESTFFNGNSVAPWTAGNVQYLEHAVAAGKTVFDIEYPTSAANQQTAINQAIADGFVPFIADQALDNNIAAINSEILGLLPAIAMTSVTGNSTVASGGTGTTGTGTTGTGSGTGGTTTGGTTYNVTNIPNGTTTVYGNTMDQEFAFNAGYSGHATIQYFGADVGDVIGISHTLYSTAAQVMSHITYNSSNGNAAIHLPGTGNTITVAHAGVNSLVASDFIIL